MSIFGSMFGSGTQEKTFEEKAAEDRIKLAQENANRVMGRRGTVKGKPGRAMGFRNTDDRDVQFRFDDGTSEWVAWASVTYVTEPGTKED